MGSRISKADRKALKQLVTRLVTDPEGEGAIENAAINCASFISHWLRTKYPEEDLQVLRRYGYVTTRSSIGVILDSSKKESPILNMEGHNDLEITLVQIPPCDVPHKVSYSHTYLYVAPMDPSSIGQALMRLRVLTEEHAQRLAAIQAPYHRAIEVCQTWKQVIEIWPEAASLQNTPACPIMLSTFELRSAIQADMARRGL